MMEVILKDVWTFVVTVVSILLTWKHVWSHRHAYGLV